MGVSTICTLKLIRSVFSHARSNPRNDCTHPPNPLIARTAPKDNSNPLWYSR